jgi:hypothetical protein
VASRGVTRSAAIILKASRSSGLTKHQREACAKWLRSQAKLLPKVGKKFKSYTVRFYFSGIPQRKPTKNITNG